MATATKKKIVRRKPVVQPTADAEPQNEPVRRTIRYTWMNKRLGAPRTPNFSAEYGTFTDALYHDGVGQVVQVNKSSQTFYVEHFPVGFKVDDDGVPTEFLATVFFRPDDVTGDVELCTLRLADGDDEFDIFWCNDAHHTKPMGEEEIWTFVQELIDLRRHEGRIA